MCQSTTTFDLESFSVYRQMYRGRISLCERHRLAMQQTKGVLDRPSTHAANVLSAEMMTSLRLVLFKLCRILMSCYNLVHHIIERNILQLSAIVQI